MNLQNTSGKKETPLSACWGLLDELRLVKPGSYLLICQGLQAGPCSLWMSRRTVGIAVVLRLILPKNPSRRHSSWELC